MKSGAELEVVTAVLRAPTLQLQGQAELVAEDVEGLADVVFPVGLGLLLVRVLVPLESDPLGLGLEVDRELVPLES
jgi:hypothetical protein